MDDLHRICEESRVFLRREALAAGYDDRMLAREVRAGVLHRVRRGAYMFRDEWQALDARGGHLALTAAALRTAETPSVLSHVTAAAAHGCPLWELDLEEVHLTRLDRRAGRREAGVRQHRGLLLPEHIVDVDGVMVTSPARTAVDLTTMTDVEHALPVVDDLLHRKLVTPTELREVSRMMDRTPGTLTTDLTLALADAGSESVGESRSGLIFWRHGLPAPLRQFEIRDSRGVVIARLDFAWPDLGVFCEFDGKEKYLKFLKDGESAIDVMRRERAREERVCMLTGWRCKRLTWADLYRPAEVCAHLRTLMQLTAA